MASAFFPSIAEATPPGSNSASAALHSNSNSNPAPVHTSSHSSEYHSSQQRGLDDRRSQERSDRDRTHDRDHVADRKRHSRSRSRSRSPRRSNRKSRSRSRSPRHSAVSNYAYNSSTSASSSTSSTRKSAVDRRECTIFISGLHPKVTDYDLFEFFSEVGTVIDIQIISDPRTGKSKGHAYLEFNEVDDAVKSLQTQGQLICGYPFTVALSVPQRASKSAAARGSNAESKDGLRLYVGSLPFHIGESELEPIFSAFGEIDHIEVCRDLKTGQSKGFGFISMRKKEEGEMAIAALDGYTLLDRPIKVGYATPAADAKKAEADAASASAATGQSQPMSAAATIRQALLPTPAGASAPLLPTPYIPPTSFVQQQPPAALTSSQLQPSNCLRISNMFDPATEEQGFERDLEEDVAEEVEKFGKLNSIRVDSKSPLGQLGLKFESIDAAVQTQRLMHGRFFQKRQLVCEFITEDAFQQLFG